MARVRIIELGNDLKGVMDDLARALEGVYDPTKPRVESAVAGTKTEREVQNARTGYLRVASVAADSPAASAVSRRKSRGLLVRRG